jgi:hypothetical protein
MPTLDDAPTIAPIAAADLTGADLIQVFSMGLRKPKTASITSLISANSRLSGYGGILAADVTSTPSVVSLTLSTRLTVVTGSTQACQLVFPSATGTLRELIVTNQMTTAAVTPPALSSTATTLTAGSAAAFGGTGAVGATARFLSNGTSWYRVS